MNAAIFGRYFLDYALLYPSGFLCLACLWEKVRSPRRTACIAAVGITAVCLVCAALCTIFELDSFCFCPSCCAPSGFCAGA